jgi:hypothetical protein
VRADPAWKGKSASAVAAEAARRFDAGARAFFSATVATIRKVRPNMRIGFYSQGINQGNSTSGMADNTALAWLWDIVDVLAPSIYPRSTNASSEVPRVAVQIAGALRSADLAGARRARYGRERQTKQGEQQDGQREERQEEQQGEPQEPQPQPQPQPQQHHHHTPPSPPSPQQQHLDREHRALSLLTQSARPAVMPYARALVGSDTQPFTRGILASQVQLAAGMGADGVVLWGASSDYHAGTPGCAAIEGAITTFIGPVIATCLGNRIACARSRCSGHGRCVDFRAGSHVFVEDICTNNTLSTGKHSTGKQWEVTSAAMQATVKAACRCDVGFAGADCSAAVGAVLK